MEAAFAGDQVPLSRIDRHVCAFLLHPTRLCIATLISATHLFARTAFYISNLIRECCDEGEALAAKPATLAFLSNVLPLGPVLLLGFLCLEGSELA